MMSNGQQQRLGRALPDAQRYRSASQSLSRLRAQNRAATSHHMHSHVIPRKIPEASREA